MKAWPCHLELFSATTPSETAWVMARQGRVLLADHQEWAVTLRPHGRLPQTSNLFSAWQIPNFLPPSLYSYFEGNKRDREDQMSHKTMVWCLSVKKEANYTSWHWRNVNRRQWHSHSKHVFKYIIIFCSSSHPLFLLCHQTLQQSESRTTLSVVCFENKWLKLLIARVISNTYHSKSRLRVPQLEAEIWPTPFLFLL